jgi:hypothetical protein
MQFDLPRRRELIALIGSAAALPLVVHALTIPDWLLAIADEVIE